MNRQQVIATTVVSLLLVIVYLCPWRIESTNELQWSPINRPPMSYVRSYDEEHGVQGSSRIESDEAHIAVGVLALEIFAVLVAGGVLYLLTSDSSTDEDKEAPTET